jgi:predicted metal-dependent hydrolase
MYPPEDAMTDLVVRRLLVDMEQPIERHWCDGDAFRTALFDALSMSFPVGEQFFIDSVRNGFEALPAAAQERFRAEVQGFVGQEATHRRLHGLYNAHLERRGLANHWEPRARARLELLRGADVRHWLAITAANEHFTAILADWMLHNPHQLGDRDPRLATLWLWHSAEESEHKCTAFDLYQALGGDHAWRRTWFRRVTLIFLTDTLRQTVSNLRQDGSLWRWRTWRSAAATLFGRRGLVRQTLRPWAAYLRRDFHPSQQDSTASQNWLAANQDRYALVGR